MKYSVINKGEFFWSKHYIDLYEQTQIICPVLFTCTLFFGFFFFNMYFVTTIKKTNFGTENISVFSLSYMSFGYMNLMNGEKLIKET